MERLRTSCRLCMNTAGKGIQIFSKNKKKYAGQVMEMFGIQVGSHFPLPLYSSSDSHLSISFQLEDKDMWPTSACGSCIQILDEVAVLKEKVAKSQDKISKIISETLVKCEEEVPDPSAYVDVKIEETLNEPMEQDLKPDIPEETPDDSSFRTRSGQVAPPAKPKKIESAEERKERIQKAQKEKIVKRVNYQKAKEDRRQLLQKKAERKEERGRLEEVMRKLSLLTCRVCHEELPNVRDLKRHLENVHGQKTKVLMICCERKFDSRTVFDHMKYHEDKEAFRCKECGKQFKSNRDFRIHQKTVHAGADVQKYTCETCGKWFVTTFNLKHHQKTHLKPEEREFQCDICQKGYVTKAQLEMHLASVHNKEANVCCEICGKSYATSSSLSVHLKSHDESKTEQCDLCGKYFFSVKTHKKRIHSNLEKVPCPDCGRPIKPHFMVTHKRLYHSGQVWKCEFCPKEFKMQKTLKDHQNVHLGIKMKCYFCPVEPTNSSNLIKHLLQAHPVEYAEYKAKRYSEQKIKNQKD